MLKILSNIEYNSSGDTYIATDEDASYLVYSEHDMGGSFYELTFIETDRDFAGSYEQIGDSVRVEFYDDIVFVIESLIGRLCSLVADGDTGRENILMAWKDACAEAAAI